MIPFYLPGLFLDSLLVKRDQNILTAGKKGMTGIINVSSSKIFQMVEVKDLSKKLGVTVNDMLMSATSCAFKKYFKLKGDKLGDSSNIEPMINVLIPANIRWKMYQTSADVIPENKFAAIPLKMPLVENMKDSYGPIS